MQFEQRKFLQQHKIRADSYSKAAATMKKQRKKKNNAQNADKEIKVNTIFTSLEYQNRKNWLTSSCNYVTLREILTFSNRIE